MNKLVSKNPVLRFKLGRKIVKAYRGIDSKKLKLVGNDNWGSPLYFNPSDNKLYSKAWLGGYSYVGDEYKYTDLFGGKSGIIKASDYIQKPKLAPLNIEEETKVLENLNPKSTKLQLQSPITKPTTTGPKTISKQPSNNSMFLAKQGGWNKSIGLGNINDQESKDILNKLGWKDKTAEQVQQLLNSNNIGGYAVNVDNKWGNLSKDALKKYYERYLKELLINPIVPTPEPATLKTDEYYQSQKPSNQPSAFPKVEMPYTSTGTYDLDNSRTLKTLGIKDYNSLFNFVERNPGSAIASDLKLRFGETSGWNQLNIENEIGIGGHYGRMNRNALWGYLSGLKSKYNLDYARKLGMMMLGYNKQGGQLVSRNPIVRFKQGSSFGKAFREARAAGLKEFEWNGKKYHTRTKEEEETRKKQPSANKKVTVYTPSGKKETTLTDSTENKKPTYTPSDSIKNKKLFVPK